MIDIRPVHEAEAEQFLELLCDVFGLDFNRAFDVFFTEPYFDLDRKWALFDGPEIVSILTTTPVEFGWGKGIGIAGVATRTSRRNEGYAGLLIERVLKEYAKKGEDRALLFAKDTRIYDRLGFEVLDRVLRGPVNLEPDQSADPLEHSDIRSIYDAWAAAHPDRLRRDAQRWNYWNWHFRVCEPFQSGYLCHEVNMLREAIYDTPRDSLPMPAGTEWFGTTLMTDLLEIPVHDAKVELYLMGHQVPGIPQMFMTDQF